MSIRNQNVKYWRIHTKCEAHVFSEKCKIDDPRLCGSCQTHFLSLTPEIVNNKDKGMLPQNPCYYLRFSWYPSNEKRKGLEAFM